MLIGFSPTVGYSCVGCRAVCCRSDYKLPLFTEEKLFYEEHVRHARPFISKEKQNEPKHSLLRTDSCLFLEDGLCSLHTTFGPASKPLVCQVYPLIFWKMPPNGIPFVYIYPCRGFRWVAPPEHRVTQKSVGEVYDRTKNSFKTFFADQVDDYNSFEGISASRLTEAQEDLPYLQFGSSHPPSDLRWIDKTWDSIGLVRTKKCVGDILGTDLPEGVRQWTEYHNSVCHWLLFAPFMLTLEHKVASVLTLTGLAVAKQQLLLSYSNNPELTSKTLNQLLEQVAWGAAKAVTSEGWNTVIQLTQHQFPPHWAGVAKELMKVQKWLPFYDGSE